MKLVANSAESGYVCNTKFIRKYSKSFDIKFFSEAPFLLKFFKNRPLFLSFDQITKNDQRMLCRCEFFIRNTRVYFKSFIMHNNDMGYNNYIRGNNGL